MNDADNSNLPVKTLLSRSDAATALAREAGVPFQPQLGCAFDIDPIAGWLSLMEVVQMLCPVWPVRDKPTQGDH